MVKASNPTDLSGDWQSFYRYPSSGRGGAEFWSQHVLRAVQSGDALRLESLPDSKSRVVIELAIGLDGHASGTWAETTDPTGYYKGAVYSGTIELTITPAADKMSGVWRGKGKDGEMNSDVWELTKINTEPAA